MVQKQSGTGSPVSQGISFGSSLHEAKMNANNNAVSVTERSFIGLDFRDYVQYNGILRLQMPNFAYPIPIQ